MAGRRLALYKKRRRGDTVRASHWVEAMERVWSHPDVPLRLQLNRGDIGFVQQKITAWHEMPGVARPRYLLKLKLTANVRRAITQVLGPSLPDGPASELSNTTRRG